MRRPSAAVFTYSQEVDSCGPADGICNELEIEVSDAGGGPYLVLRTARWAVDDPEELVAMLRGALEICEDES